MVARSICVLTTFAIIQFSSIPFSSKAAASETISPRVPGFERFYAAPPPKKSDDDEDDPIVLDAVTGGRILISELGCTACHAPDANARTSFPGKQAPILDSVGSRIKPEWIRSFLTNPHSVKPGTTMPNLIESLPEATRSSAAEALTHFLASTGVVAEGHSDPTAAKKGETLFRSVGCLACHNDISEKSPQFTTSVSLPELDKKYSGPSLAAFLKDPLKSRPSGRMPALGLADEDYVNLAHFFVKNSNVTPNVQYDLYDGSWTSVPKFDALNVAQNGVSIGFDLSMTNRSNDYSIRFKSHLHILNEGEYQFWIGSDDGSRLMIDDELVVDCDGIHPHQTVAGRKQLGAGFHKVTIEYFQAGGGASLEVQIAGPGLVRQPLSGHLFLQPQVPEAAPDKPVFTINADQVAKGRALFSSIGCASCHALTIDGQKIASELTSKSQAILSVNAGCMAEKVVGKAPRYGLNATQRSSITLAWMTRNAESTSEEVHRTLATLNCYACHTRDKIGGVEAARDSLFQSRQKEMGDEGRLPPTLTGVGDKLRPEWLKQVLHNGADDRKEYLVTKMPRFGATNVDPLVTQFAAIDLKPDNMPGAVFTEPEYRVKAAGRHLVGGQALSCIKCHDFGPHPSTGIRAINLTSMHQRIRPDWFYRYVLDPQTFRRGTRMPAPWPFGQTTIRDLLNADVNLQVQAVWMYLSDRDKAAVPVGLVREPIELKPSSEPIIYRNFIEGAGARAIGVGYPESVNLAFDANDVRLALIWHGTFIDASRHWSGRGQGFEPPLGDDILSLPSGIPFVVLDQGDRELPSQPERNPAGKFLGYRLDQNQRPIFRYSIYGLTVEDHAVPEPGNGKFSMLMRTLRFEGTANTNQIWYRAAAADKLEKVTPDQYRIDGNWTMKIGGTGSEEARIRDSAGKQELLIPVQLKNGKAEINQRYIW